MPPLRSRCRLPNDVIAWAIANAELHRLSVATLLGAVILAEMRHIPLMLPRPSRTPAKAPPVLGHFLDVDLPDAISDVTLGAKTPKRRDHLATYLGSLVMAYKDRLDRQAKTSAMTAARTKQAGALPRHIAGT